MTAHVSDVETCVAATSRGNEDDAWHRWFCSCGARGRGWQDRQANALDLWTQHVIRAELKALST